MKDRGLQFNFGKIAEALATTIESRSREGAFVVGISGPWGSGKTTLMNAVTANLPAPKHIPIYFNAWAHSRRDEIWRGLFVAITSALRERILAQPNENSAMFVKRLQDVERSLYEAFTKSEPGHIEIDGGKLAKAGVKIMLKVLPWGGLAGNLLNAIEGNENKPSKGKEEEKFSSEDIEGLFDVFKRHVVMTEFRHVQSLEQFKNSLECLLSDILTNDELLVVSVDDVDRCLPEQQLEIFEAIKLFLDIPGAVFLIAMDQDVIQHALDIRYKQEGLQGKRITAEIYIEKMVDLNFMIPPPATEIFSKFLANCALQPDIMKRNYKLLASGLPVNPRTWLRFAERADFYFRLVLENDEVLCEEQYACFLKLQLLSFRWPSFMRAIGSIESLILAEKCVLAAKVLTDGFAESVRKKGSPLDAVREGSIDVRHIAPTALYFFDDMHLLRVLASEPQIVDSAPQFRAALIRFFNVGLE